MKYLAIIEKASANFSAYFPDIPGCIATGRTIEEVKERLNIALEIHLQGMMEDGEPIPEPSTSAEYLEINTAGA